MGQPPDVIAWNNAAKWARHLPPSRYNPTLKSPYPPYPPYIMMSHRKFEKNITPKIDKIEAVFMIGLDKATGTPCDPNAPNVEPYYCISALASGCVNILMNNSFSYLLLEREYSFCGGWAHADQFYTPSDCLLDSDTKFISDSKFIWRVLSEEKAIIKRKLSIEDQHALNIAKRHFRKRVFGK